MRHARLNPRYFYESFADLDELLVAVYDDVLRQLHRRVAKAVTEAADDDAAMRGAIEATVRFVDEDRRRGRVIYVEALGNEAMNRRRVEADAGLVALVQQDHSRRDGRDHDPRIGTLGAAMLVGGFAELLMSWLAGRVELTPDELIDDATEVCLAIRDATRRLHAGERTAS